MIRKAFRILFITVFCIFLYSPVYAEVSKPYFVDEKDQVIFGDSAIVDEHQGLQNYSYDYVNGYLHMSFTYSHASAPFVWASYPAYLYVTDADPRLSVDNISRRTPGVTFDTITATTTDWYLIDVQFDSTGYTLKSFERGVYEMYSSHFSIDNLNIVGNEWVSLVNDFPRFGSSGNGSSMSFTPLQISTSTQICKIDCNSSVLFIPGLEASRLYEKRSDGTEDQLWEPNGNSDIEALYLNSDGTSIKSNIYTRDIIKETNVPVPSGFAGQNIYKSFSDMMDGLVSGGKIKEWKSYPYDWRKDVNDIVNNETLGSTLQSLVASSTSGKVTIVAHSNGGLIAKALLKKLQDDKLAGRNNLIDKVDVLILVAVPEIGTASAVPGILHGYDQKIGYGWLMDEVHARELGRNMYGGYGLLPSKEYINHVSSSPVTFVDNLIPSGLTTSFVQSYGTAISSYSEYTNFLFGNEGRVNPLSTQTNLPIKITPSIFAKAESLHNSIDNFTPPSSMRVIEVAGWGLETIASFEYYPKSAGCSAGNSGAGCSNSYLLDARPRFTVDGDKTVVTPSAQYMSFQGNAEKYWVDLKKYNKSTFSKINHANILELNLLENFISSLIENKAIITDTVLKNTLPVYTGNRLRLSIHSPVTLDAYDSAGNHTGKICLSTSDFCYVEENIVNSSYLEFGEGKYINLPEEELKNIKLQGTDIGTFTYESEKVLPDGTINVSKFVDIPVTSQTQAEIVLKEVTLTPELKLDVTGDGVVDFTLTPNSAFDPVAYLQIMKATIDSIDISESKKNTFDKRIDNIIKQIQKGKIDKAKLKADKFKSVLENKISKPDPKHPKPKKISKSDAQLLLDMLNQLLDNIG